GTKEGCTFLGSHSYSCIAGGSFTSPPFDQYKGPWRDWTITGLPRNCPLFIFAIAGGRATASDGIHLNSVMGWVTLHRSSATTIPSIPVGSGYYAGSLSLWSTTPGELLRHYGGTVTGTVNCVTGVASLTGNSYN